MDVAFLAEFTQGKQVYRALDGDAASFGWEIGEGPALPDTYCRLMTQGQLPNAIPDAKADLRVKDLAVTSAADIGSYVGVPVRRADGTLYGSLCCLSHESEDLHERDVNFLTMLASLVEEEVETEIQRQNARAGLLGLIHKEHVDIALQPIVDIATGRVLGVESLSRFSPDRGTPDTVFTAAHEAGLGLELERLAAASAFNLLPLLDHDRYLAVNLTPLAALELADAAHDVPGMPYHRLVLEITEHAVVENYAALRDRLAPAREQGLRLAIDDAGAGYASLHHIVELQPDIIKIDRSLINGVSRTNALQSVVKAFVMLAKDLAATVIGEGVEDGADLATARDLGVSAVQGYLLARPTTDRADLSRWLSEGVSFLPARSTTSGTTRP